MLILWLGFLACEGSSLAAAPLSDVDIARLMNNEAADRIADLLAYGVPFDRDLEGRRTTG